MVAWWSLYGFPWDPRLWVAFFTHDLGYVGCRKMDDAEGEKHVEFGARLMHWLFDRPFIKKGAEKCEWYDTYPGINCSEWKCPHCRTKWVSVEAPYCSCQLRFYWQDFCLYHSRFYAKRDGKLFSRLCVADKLAIVLTPSWLYLPLARASGELQEAMGLTTTRYAAMNLPSDDPREWHRNVKTYLRKWVEENKEK